MDNRPKSHYYPRAINKNKNGSKMKSKISVISLLISTALISSNSFAKKKCYDVTGNTVTKNITETIQVGNIALTLTGADGNVVFSETGSLVGVITGTLQDGRPILSHTAKFHKGVSFTSEGDIATPTSDPSGCSFSAMEVISRFAKGTKLFSKLQPNLNDGGIVAEGNFSNCPDLNENTFSFRGQVCDE